MDYPPELAGPHDPVLVTAARPAGSIRRTTNIDTTRPNGLRADAEVDARARDLRTNPDGTTDVVGEASYRATLSPQRNLLSIETSPDVSALQQLVGASVGTGFRSRLNEVVEHAEADGCQDGSLLYLLLDDLPGASLVSGYATMRVAATDAPAPASSQTPERSQPPEASRSAASPRPAPNLSRMSGVCAGWADDASLILHIRTKGSIPVPIGPSAPVLERDGDSFSWHEMAVLPPQSVRRRRRLDLIAPASPGDGHRIDLHFRDSYTGEGGDEAVLHEYSVSGTADLKNGRIGSVVARAQVLPWTECPGSLASAERIAGMELSVLRGTIRKEFVGSSTCTHLNDSLRSLADITVLAQELESTSS
jgi:hypothetical protein